jgi:hypothetical protein
MKAKLFPKSMDPLHRSTHNSGVGFWMKDQPEVIKIVMKTSWDMMGNDPVQSFRKRLKMYGAEHRPNM